MPWRKRVIYIFYSCMNQIRALHTHLALKLKIMSFLDEGQHLFDSFEHNQQFHSQAWSAMWRTINYDDVTRTHHGTGARNNLCRFALETDLAQASPLPELLPRIHLSKPKCAKMKSWWIIVVWTTHEGSTQVDWISTWYHLLHVTYSFTTHHNQVHTSLIAQSADKLGVLRIIAVLRQTTQTGRPTVEHLSTPAELQCLVNDYEVHVCITTATAIKATCYRQLNLKRARASMIHFTLDFKICWHRVAQWWERRVGGFQHVTDDCTLQHVFCSILTLAWQSRRQAVDVRWVN